MSWSTNTVKDWSHFMQIADLVASESPAIWRYMSRGQADSAWSLVPSLTREDSKFREGSKISLEPHQWLEVEQVLRQEFEAQAHLHLRPSILGKQDYLGWWTLMQHYFAPTRLLDWSSSIFVAAYHAVVDAWDKDGVVWLFHTRTLVEGMKEQFQGHQMLPRPVEREDFLKSNAPSELYVIGRRWQTDRMVAQQGAFTVCKQILADHGQIIADVIGKEGRKFIISRDLKPNFLRRLHDANITASALFPGVDGLGRSVGEMARLHADYLGSQESQGDRS